jgi:hypothetical protein
MCTLVTQILGHLFDKLRRIKSCLSQRLQLLGWCHRHLVAFHQTLVGWRLLSKMGTKKAAPEFSINQNFR